MGDHPCYAALERSRAAHKNDRPTEALALAEAAYRMWRDIPGAPRDAAISASWYGFLLGTAGSRYGDGVSLCRSVASELFWEPRAFENLARLELAAGRRREALRALEQGLALAPEHLELRALRATLGRRRRPPIPFLHRSNPINRMLGRLFHRQ